MDIPISYLQPPATIVNQALDSIGASDKVLGDISDGSNVGEASRRNYGQVLRQLLRANHWPFARKYAKLTLLGDATGQSALPVITQVECPWTYAYAWPIDGVQGRWMPANYPNGQPTTPTGLPLTTGTTALSQYPQLPGRFLVSSSDLYPVEIGSVAWTAMPDLQRTEGLGPINRKIILTNTCDAYFVYTRLVSVIEEWDDMFRQAMVALMALVLAPVAIIDPEERLAQRNAMIAIAKNILADARVAANNEAGFPMTTDHQPPWITARNSGYYGYGSDFGGGGTLGFYMPWEPFSLGGSVF
jgi:hypothetical protein